MNNLPRGVACVRNLTFVEKPPESSGHNLPIISASVPDQRFVVVALALGSPSESYSEGKFQTAAFGKGIISGGEFPQLTLSVTPYLYNSAR